MAWWSVGVESRYEVPKVGSTPAMVSRWGWRWAADASDLEEGRPRVIDASQPDDRNHQHHRSVESQAHGSGQAGCGRPSGAVPRRPS